MPFDLEDRPLRPRRLAGRRFTVQLSGHVLARLDLVSSDFVIADQAVVKIAIEEGLASDIDAAIVRRGYRRGGLFGESLVLLGDDADTVSRVSARPWAWRMARGCLHSKR